LRKKNNHRKYHLNFLSRFSGAFVLRTLFTHIRLYITTFTWSRRN